MPEMSTADLKQALYPQGNILNHSSLDNDQFSPLQRKGSMYWCHVCNKGLQNKNLYEYHINAHAGVRPYKCEVCDRKFGSKQVLQTHQRLHSGERPFQCTKCDRSFTARSGLVYHMNKHHKE
jgi:KRAB domain-containing zinc finger protein